MLIIISGLYETSSRFFVATDTDTIFSLTQKALLVQHIALTIYILKSSAFNFPSRLLASVVVCRVTRSRPPSISYPHSDTVDMSIFAKIKSSKKAAEEHKAQKAASDAAEAAKPAPAPYRHVPKHAAQDAISGTPGMTDKQAIREANKQRSMYAGRDNFYSSASPSLSRLGSEAGSIRGANTAGNSRSSSRVRPPLQDRRSHPGYSSYQNLSLTTQERRHGGKVGARDYFIDGFNRVFNQIRNGMPEADGVPLTVYYAYKQQDSDSSGATSTGWHTLLDGLVTAGWETLQAMDALVTDPVSTTLRRTRR